MIKISAKKLFFGIFILELLLTSGVSTVAILAPFTSWVFFASFVAFVGLEALHECFENCDLKELDDLKCVEEWVYYISEGRCVVLSMLTFAHIASTWS